MDTTTTAAAATWTAHVWSDVYAGQFNEDGERPDELCFYVVCENERGERFGSVASFTTERFWHDAEARAEALCERVTEYLAKGCDPSTSPKWVRRQGCYGSAAWSEKAELELEARDLEAEAGCDEAGRFRRAVGL